VRWWSGRLRAWRRVGAQRLPTGQVWVPKTRCGAELVVGETIGGWSRLLVTGLSDASPNCWSFAADQMPKTLSRSSFCVMNSRCFAVRPVDRAAARSTGSCSAPSRNYSHGIAGKACSCGRRRSAAGIARSSRDAGRTDTRQRPAAQPPVPASGNWLCGSRVRTRPGVTGGSTASSRALRSLSGRALCGRSSSAPALTQHHAARPRVGGRFFECRRLGSSPATSAATSNASYVPTSTTTTLTGRTGRSISVHPLSQAPSPDPQVTPPTSAAKTAWAASSTNTKPPHESPNQVSGTHTQRRARPIRRHLAPRPSPTRTSHNDLPRSHPHRLHRPPAAHTPTRDYRSLAPHTTPADTPPHPLTQQPVFRLRAPDARSGADPSGRLDGGRAPVRSAAVIHVGEASRAPAQRPPPPEHDVNAVASAQPRLSACSDRVSGTHREDNDVLGIEVVALVEKHTTRRSDLR
jgi:hypothetical protein